MAVGYAMAALKDAGVMEATGERGYWKPTGRTKTGREIAQDYDAAKERRRLGKQDPNTPKRGDKPQPLCAVCGTNHPGEC